MSLTDTVAAASLLAFAVFSVPILGAYSSPALVRTTNETVVGVTDAVNGVQKFLGIPFAEPPVGDQRLRQAVPLKGPFGVLRADSFGPACYGWNTEINASEYCLTLNIWRPIETATGNGSLPVLVWLCGGGLAGGYSVSRSLFITARRVAC